MNNFEWLRKSLHEKKLAREEEIKKRDKEIAERYKDVKEINPVGLGI